MNLTQVTLRPALPQDINFIYSTWINSYQFGSTLGRGMRKSVFQPSYRRVIDAILASPGTMVWVAAALNDPHTILAYLVLEDKHIIHYAFTKEPFRRLGLQWLLSNNSGMQYRAKTYTHVTNQVKQWVPAEWTYNPLMLYKQGFDK